MTDSQKDAAAATARTLIALVLLASGVHKSFAAPEEFAAVLEKYYLLPQHWLLPFSQLLPAVEVLVGTALLLGWRVKASSTAALACFAAFFGALLSTKLRGIPLEDCGCFGKGIHLKPEATMALDSVLVALSYWSRTRPKAFAWLDAWTQRGSD